MWDRKEACGEGWEGPPRVEGVSRTAMGHADTSSRQATSSCFLGSGRFPGRSLYTTH